MPTFRFGSLILALVLLAATGIIGIVTVEKLKSSREMALHTYEVRGLLKDLRSDIGEDHADFDLYLLSRNPQEAQGLEREAEEQLGTLRELRRLTSDNPRQQERLEEFHRILEEDVDQLRACVRGPSCLGSDPSDRSDRLADIFGRRRTMSAMLRDMEESEANLLMQRLQMWDQLFNRMVVTLVGAFVLALILLVYNFSLLIREIEQRKEQQQIERKNAESYRMLSARILELQDVERRRIARELHDSVGQYLAGLKLNLGRLQRRDTGAAQPLLAEAVDLTDRAIVEVRTISHLLHPPLLDELGFYSAARWYAEGFAQRSGIKIELKFAEIVERLPKEIELALFRVLQESLTNIHRHANANLVEVVVECTDIEVILCVDDNGRGIQQHILERFNAGEAGGIGLSGMRERLAELGGKLEVQSTARGTQIRATLPTGECDPNDASEEKITITPARPAQPA
jgi:signal transduction histidine kinase